MALIPSVSLVSHIVFPPAFRPLVSTWRRKINTLSRSINYNICIIDDDWWSTKEYSIPV